MEKIRNNYITIQGWMVSDLNLKGNELILYALIYGFSQDEESKFSGSLNYMMNWLNCSKQSIINTLNSLIDKNLITKTKSEDNQKCFYKVVKNFDQSKNLTSQKIRQDQSKNLTRVVKNFDQTSQKIRPNNIIYNNINNTNDNNISVDNFSEEDFSELEDLVEEEVIIEEKQIVKKVKQIDNDFLEFAKGIKNIVESKKRIQVNHNQLISWAKEIEKLYKKIAFRGEEQAKEDIRQAIQFLIDHTNEQYVPVVESGKSFYEKFSKVEDAMARQKEKDIWKIDTSCLEGFHDFSKFFN